MDVGSPRPFARAWQLRGGDLDDPAFPTALCSEVVPRLEQIPGHLGLIVLLDPRGTLLRGISLWDSEETLQESAGVVSRVVDALLGLSSAELAGPWTYELVISRFWGRLERPTQLGEVRQLLVRSRRLEGAGATDPATVERFAWHGSAVLARTPGCLGTLLLVDHDRCGLREISFWVDAAAARRTEPGTAELPESVTRPAGAVPSDLGVYDVLVSRPVQR